MIQDSSDKTITTTSTIAKLLASEDISVEQKQLPTAYFDVKNRVLGLPLWASENKDVHDLLVGHEVGHALYTPVDFAKIVDEVDTDNDKAVLSYHNVIEDIRIEKKIKSKFPGLKRNFYKGYQELVERDFFGTEGKDTSKYGLIDRLNIHYKSEKYIDLNIHFSDREKPFLTLIDNHLNTWDDTVKIVKALYVYSQNNEVETLKDYDYNNVTSGESDETADGSTTEDTDNYEFSDNPSNKGNADSDSRESNDDTDSDDVGDDIGDSNSGGKPSASKTQDHFEKELQKLADDPYNYNNIPQYTTIPDVDAEDYIVDYKEVQTYLGKELSAIFGDTRYARDFEMQIKSDFKKFKISTNKTVNYLVKEFELKKNAQCHVRASISKTGVIDTNRLHSYQINDDIFKRVTNLPEGKNHGLLFFFDLSGSMQNHIAPTIRQLINLIMFCNKVNIPFEVYGFTDAGTGFRKISDDKQTKKTTYKEKDLILHDFNLRNYASSKMRGKELNDAIFHLYALSWLWDSYSSLVPADERLGSTPLNDAIITAHDIIPKFKSQYSLEKVHVVFLTDGESNSLDYVRDSSTNSGYNHVNSYSKKVITDPITKIQYSYNGRHESTSCLLQSLQDRHGIKTIGFFICSIAGIGRHLKYSHHDYGTVFDTDQEMTNFIKKVKKDKFGIIEKYGYADYYIVIGGSNLNTDSDEFDVDKDSTKGKLTTAFKKHTKSRTMSRVILTRFIDTIS
ncbi:MAG: hypothetical protein CL489_06825 [Acidobacteria bacterium]|nr:hypothetical protein [Acidobacteriota bacterium]